jgi:Aldo/keto reductase family
MRHDGAAVCIPLNRACGRFIKEEETMAERTEHGDMPYRVLGSTGEQVSALGLGGWHLGFKGVDERLSLRIVREAIDRGITFMDNCSDYNDGASEIRMGKAFRRPSAVARLLRGVTPIRVGVTAPHRVCYISPSD